MSEWWEKKFDEPPVLTESERIVVDLILSGVDEYEIPEKLGIDRRSYFDWRYQSNKYGITGRIRLLSSARIWVEENFHGDFLEERLSSVEAGLLRYRNKVRDDVIERLIEESQKDE